MPNEPFTKETISKEYLLSFKMEDINIDLSQLEGLAELVSELSEKMSILFTNSYIIEIDSSDLTVASSDVKTLIDNLENLNTKIEFKPNTSGWDFVNFLATFTGVIVSIIAIVEAAQPASKKALKKLFENLKAVIENNDFKKVMETIGENIAEGLINGLKGKNIEIEQTVWNVTKGIKETVVTTYEIKSPSKVMQRLGEYISQGLGIGISDGTKDAIKAMDEMGDGVKDASKSLSKIGDGAKDYTKSLDDVGDATEKVNKKKISFGGVFTVVAGVLATIVGLFTNLMDSNDGFREKVEEVWGKIQEAFQPVVDIVTNFFAGFVTGSEETGGAMDTIMSIVSGASDFICAIIQWISDFWAQNGEAIMAGIQAIWDFLQPIVEGIMTFVGGLFSFIMGIFTGNTEEIKEGLLQMWEGIKKIFEPVIDFFVGIFQKAWEGIKNAFSAVGNFFSGIWESIKSIFGMIGSAIGNAIGDAFKFVVNSVIGFAENMINGFIKAINAAIKLINAIPGVEISYITPLSIPRLAAGGLVDAGQLFVAREAGPELVGRFGNMTAVMNNSQIVEAVAGGVYSAVSAALAGNNSSEQPLNVTLKVGETDFGKIVVNSINSLSRVQGSVNLAV